MDVMLTNILLFLIERFNKLSKFCWMLIQGNLKKWERKLRRKFEKKEMGKWRQRRLDCGHKEKKNVRQVSYEVKLHII